LLVKNVEALVRSGVNADGHVAELATPLIHLNRFARRERMLHACGDIPFIIGFR